MPRAGELSAAASGATRPEAWRAVRTGDGSATLAHPLHGALCHSDAGAWQQARERYAGGCRLAARARAGAALRLLDVGTGLGWNLAAALAALEPAGGALEAWSLERDPGVLRAALGLAGEACGPAAAERWHAPVRDALARALDAAERGASADRAATPLPGGSRLVLLLGDARETLPRLPADLRFDAVFLDPFAPAVEPELWQPAFLRALAERMAEGAWLATYAAGLAVRAGLAAAGLCVGAGPRVGRKREGTLAGRGVEPPPLTPRTARRVARRAQALRSAAP